MYGKGCLYMFHQLQRQRIYTKLIIKSKETKCRKVRFAIILENFCILNYFLKADFIVTVLVICLKTQNKFSLLQK